jgi:hypothetical protein
LHTTTRWWPPDKLTDASCRDGEEGTSLPAEKRQSASAGIIKFLKSRKLSVAYKQYNVQQGKMMLPPLNYI